MNPITPFVQQSRLDVLVNNAGILTSHKVKPFEDIPLEEWERVLRVNITGC